MYSAVLGTTALTGAEGGWATGEMMHSFFLMALRCCSNLRWLINLHYFQGAWETMKGSSEDQGQHSRGNVPGKCRRWWPRASPSHSSPLLWPHGVLWESIPQIPAAAGKGEGLDLGIWGFEDLGIWDASTTMATPGTQLRHHPLQTSLSSHSGAAMPWISVWTFPKKLKNNFFFSVEHWGRFGGTLNKNISS